MVIQRVENGGGRSSSVDQTVTLVLIYGGGLILLVIVFLQEGDRVERQHCLVVLTSVLQGLCWVVARLLEGLMVFTRHKQGVIIGLGRCSLSHEGLEVRLLLLMIQVRHRIVVPLVVLIARRGLTLLQSKKLALERGPIFQVFPLTNSYIIHVSAILLMLDERHEVHHGYLPLGKVARLVGVV